MLNSTLRGHFNIKQLLLGRKVVLSGCGFISWLDMERHPKALNKHQAKQMSHFKLKRHQNTTHTCTPYLLE